MTDQTAELLLAEFRAFRDTEFRSFRDEVNGWREENAQRLATLEAHDRDIYGNGQPGRMADAERRITRHSRLIWIATGLFAAVQAAWAVLAAWERLPWAKN